MRNGNMDISSKCTTFPVPGGPKSRMPFHGDNRPVKYLNIVEKIVKE
jgi:hypothetical protein